MGCSFFENLSYQVALGFSGWNRCVLPVVQGMPLLKRPAATSPTLSLQGPLHVYPGSECGVCKKKLYTKFLETPVQCTIVGSEVVEKAYLLRKECKEPFCVKTYRANFAYVDSVKVNTMSFRQMQDMKVYMVTHGFGFTMKYLQMFYYRLLRGNLAPGQESSVRAMVDGPLHDDLIGPRWFRHHLLRALEGYAIAQRSPDEVVPFPVDDPSSFFAPTSAPMTFDPPNSVCVLSFDGHFGVHRNLNPKWGEAPRTVRCRGRPRKKYTQEQRTCTCANKAKQRVTMKNRTAGWQFVIDPKSRRVLAAKEHLVNECSPDKVEVVRAAMKMKKSTPMPSSTMTLVILKLMFIGTSF